MCKKALSKKAFSLWGRNVTCNMKTCSVGKIVLQSQVCLSILKPPNFLCCNLLKESHSDGTLYSLKQQKEIHKRKQVKSRVWRVECEAQGSRFLCHIENVSGGRCKWRRKGPKIGLTKTQNMSTLCPEPHVFIQGKHNECFPSLL